MAEPGGERTPWLPTDRDQVVLWVLCIAVITVAGYRYASHCWARPGPVRALEATQAIAYRVDLNTADAGELDLLPGIGPARAARIIEYRKKHGPFHRAADLAGVPGMTRDCIERLKGLVVPWDDPRPGEGQ